MKKKDLYLPIWIFAFGIVLVLGALVFLYSSLKNPYLLIGAVLCLGLGIAAILCWKNQWIEVIDDHSFVYSTMFGKQTKYHTSQIVDLKQNADSMTLVLDSGKVHIESCAIMSERLIEMITKHSDQK